MSFGVIQACALTDLGAVASWWARVFALTHRMVFDRKPNDSGSAAAVAARMMPQSATAVGGSRWLGFPFD